MVQRFDSFRSLIAGQNAGNIAFEYFEEDTRKQLT